MALHPTMRPYHRALLKFWRAGNWEIGFVRLRYYYGFCLNPGAPQIKILISPSRDILDTVIHEGLHGCFPNDSEAVILRHGHTVTTHGSHQVIAAYWHAISRRLGPLSPTMRGLLNHSFCKKYRSRQPSPDRQVIRQYYRPLVWPFLVNQPYQVVFARLLRKSESWCFSDRRGDPLFIIDVYANPFQEVIAQILGWQYRDVWSDQRISGIARRIVAALTHRELVELWQVLTPHIPKRSSINPERINFDDSAPVLPPTRPSIIRAVAAKR